MMDFSEFNKRFNVEEIKNMPVNVGGFTELPAGIYDVAIDKMEIKPTKAGDKLMLAVQSSILSGEYKKRKIFFNRTIRGNTSPRWSDAQAINSVMQWLAHLQTGVNIEFINFDQFAGVVTDVFQTMSANRIGITVDHVPGAFDPLKIVEVFEY